MGEREVPRSARMSKCQKELLINYLENNKDLLATKIAPGELATVKSKWDELATLLNNQNGAKKTTKQWKESYNEFKTNVRRKARTILYDTTVTGGGSRKTKNLSEFEERLLALLSNIVIVGAPEIPEAGHLIIENENQGGSILVPATLDDVPVIFETDVNELENDVATTSSTYPLTSTRQKKRKVSHKKTSLEVVSQLHTKSLQDMAASNIAIAEAIKNLAESVTRFSNKPQHKRSAVFNLTF